MLSRVMLVFVTGSLLATSVVVGQRELSSLVQAGIPDPDFFEAVLADEVSPSLSYRASDDLLRRCVNIVGGLYGALQPEERTARARAICLDIANQTVEAMPSYALGWYAKSLFSYQLALTENGDAALISAQQIGRHEQWIAEGRVQLAEDHFSSLSPQAQAGHEQDLELLAQSRRGVASVAHRYVTQPDFRERITSIVEKLPPEDQTRFLNNVRRATLEFGMVAP
ncbi:MULTISPECIES: hypothetical protein [unclassified Devosia]|uniref:hypothetical protein n=1 Tax=unclassified Devosia TaxID=196773 RepID=UPI00145DEE49|nr:MULTISPECIES: hypothetical protein [unclassified Devosia]MBJ6989221.1 hypothetical protein [Devosia sp. MC521]QMW63341.1 hypothetical protein H4N61_03100 [Devosia sp. MC521]